MVCAPREARLLYLGVVLRTFGTANWLNFVPLARRSASDGGAIAIKIEFFCHFECTLGLVL